VGDSFVFDPRGLIIKPFEDCPCCGAESEFGLLTVSARSYTKRCRRCMKDRTYDLPLVSKRVIYLDQHAISHMAKALHPESAHLYGPDDPRTQRGFWREAFGRLDRLHKLQLLVCPSSDLQRQESLLDDRLTATLRTMYEHLAGETRFADHRGVRRAEIDEAFCAWLDNREARAVGRREIIHGRLDAWLDKIRVSARLGLEHIEGGLARGTRDRMDAELGGIVERWKSGPRLSFGEYYERELRAYAEPPWPSGWHHRMAVRMEQRGIEPSAYDQRISAFAASGRMSDVPSLRIDAAMWAALADEIVSGRAARPSRGMAYDILAIAHFLPYCDAMFVDSQCARLLTSDPVQERLPSHGRIFSIRAQDEFLDFLDDIERDAPAGHDELVRRVYGDHWLEPFEAIYTWREKDA
jgi:hypothetical protein